MKSRLTQSLPLLILILGLAAFFYFGLNRYISFEVLKSHREALLAWTNSHYVQAVLIYMLIYIIAVAISIPGATFFTLIAGFLFGAILGTLYVVISATLGALLVFFAVKTALEPWLAKKTISWINKMRAGFQKNAFEYLLFLRLAPIFPFWVVNIVPGLLGVKSSTFLITTFFGILPGSFIYVLLGSGLGQIFDQDQTPNLSIIFTPSIFIPLLALALLSLLPTWFKWIKKKRKIQ